MKYFLIFLAAAAAVLVFPLVLGAEISFERWYGGPDPDVGFSVQQTTDGGYIITGETSSYGADYFDVYLIKTGESGNVGIETPLFTVVKGINPFISISPNPFTTSATIIFSLPGAQEQLSIYDVSGRLVKDLSVGIRHLASGTCTVSWDGRDNSNRELSSGVYFLKFKTGDYAETRKLLMVR